MHLTNSSLSKPFDSWQEKTEPGNHCGGFVAAGFTVKLWEGRMEGKEFAGSPAAQALPGPGGFPVSRATSHCTLLPGSSSFCLSCLRSTFRVMKTRSFNNTMRSWESFLYLFPSIGFCSWVNIILLYVNGW